MGSLIAHAMNHELPIHKVQGIELARPPGLQPLDMPGDSLLPALRGELSRPAPRRMTITLQIHNRAGIPIIIGQETIAAGQTEIVFRHLQPLGIEAYNHASATQRQQVAQRIWSRRAYGTLACE